MNTSGKYLFPTLMLLLPACQREMAELKGPVSGETVEITVSMDPETRATLSEADGTMCFSYGDAIKVFDGTAVYTGITSSTSSEGVFAMASGFNRSGTGFAGFPADMVSTITSGGVSFILPSTYAYAQVGSLDADGARVPCPMVGRYAGGAIALKQAGAVVRFYITDVAAGSLTFAFPTNVTGTTAAIPILMDTSVGILASGLSNAGKTVTVTGVPAVAPGSYICITLPVPTGTVPQRITVKNIPADGGMPRLASAAGSSESLSRASGYRVVYETFTEPEPVDLGLSVKWANMNIGAVSETDYGDYFAWGETETKENYTWSTYKWCMGSESTMTKYCDRSTQGYNGFTDDLTVLEQIDDAASAHWGVGWRMPTQAEYQELMDLENAWVEDYEGTGVTGRKFIGRNGNVLFLPAAGQWGGANSSSVGGYCCYWSSSLGSTIAYHGFQFFSYYQGVRCVSADRYWGFSVRPVYQEEASAVELGSVEISQETLTLWIGVSQQLTATVRDTQGNTISDATVIWSNPAGTSASVDASGLVTASPSTTGASTVRATVVYHGVTKTADCAVTVRGPEAIDLGLSVKWANANIGATSEFGYGDYFAWGETETKEDYSVATYKWCMGTNSSFTKYCSNSLQGYNGYTDTRTVLDPLDDAALVHWGSDWRMPTQAEFSELLGLDKSWVENYEGSGVAGYKLTGLNGNVLFLPAAGNRQGTGLLSSGNYGCYWTSTLGVNAVYAIGILAYYNGAFTGNNNRECGYCVRPVSEK